MSTILLFPLFPLLPAMKRGSLLGGQLLVLLCSSSGLGSWWGKTSKKSKRKKYHNLPQALLEPSGCLFLFLSVWCLWSLLLCKCPRCQGQSGWERRKKEKRGRCSLHPLANRGLFSWFTGQNARVSQLPVPFLLCVFFLNPFWVKVRRQYRKTNQQTHPSYEFL